MILTDKWFDSFDGIELDMLERTAYNHLISFYEGLPTPSHESEQLKSLCIMVLERAYDSATQELIANEIILA